MAQRLYLTSRNCCYLFVRIVCSRVFAWCSHLPMDSESRSSEVSDRIPEPAASVPIPTGQVVADGVTIRDFGGGTHLYTLSDVGLHVSVTNYGATVVSARVPDREGKIDDVLLGFDDVNGYKTYKKYHIGGVVGRFANRLTWARFRLQSTIYEVSANSEDGKHHENGGFKSFDQVIWSACVPPCGHSVIFSYVSPDGEEGFPGSVFVQVQYTVIVDRLIVNMKAKTTLPTPISLRQGLLLNLAGHNGGHESLLEHDITINADKYLITTHNLNPTGVLRNVRGTRMDFRVPTNLSSTFYETKRLGFDNFFFVNTMPPDSLLYVGRIEHPPTGRVLEIHSDQPTVHLYTGRYLPPRNEARHPTIDKSNPKGSIISKQGQEVKTGNDTNRESAVMEKSIVSTVPKSSIVEQLAAADTDDITGKDESFYFENDGMWLSPQWFPNAPNVKNFENCILMPGDTYKCYTIYHFFSIKKTKKQLEKERLDEEAAAIAQEILLQVAQTAADAVDLIVTEDGESLMKVI